MIIKPKAIQPGDTIGVIAPSSPVPQEKMKKSLSIFKEFGYQLKLGQTLGQEYGYLAGSDPVRAHDINQMFADPEVDAIMCLRGGYGTPRILEMLDYDLIKRNPKPFIGYSDITALHTAIHRHTGLVTFHGPMIAELADEPDSRTWPTLFHHLSQPDLAMRYPTDMFQYTINEGTAEGRLVGGNLCLLVATLGTAFEVDTKDKIFFIEDIGEEPYSIDRMLTQLRLAGKLQQAKGLLFTDFSEAEPKQYDPSLSLEQVLHDIIKPLGIPSYYGLKSGHCQPNLTLPIGVRARMNATEGWVEFLEGGVV
ncbi:LD-carboxypeptidase [Ammoniphilus sp. CFH 90114]|uniref:S66 peptidase family protein n=1 Tax=Ammoniphilus sp. CFH 90114 TaxID=2493665 RepID=UPI00101001F0|nr:LD-carboxypeptidase [Ammoniphilus sp. CFH 90114]RXT05380.1 LD-carboxypeptidase [Ammoniphilus sp. CFH 90114]